MANRFAFLDAPDEQPQTTVQEPVSVVAPAPNRFSSLDEPAAAPANRFSFLDTPAEPQTIQPISEPALQRERVGFSGRQQPLVSPHVQTPLQPLPTIDNVENLKPEIKLALGIGEISDTFKTLPEVQSRIQETSAELGIDPKPFFREQQDAQPMIPDFNRKLTSVVDEIQNNQWEQKVRSDLEKSQVLGDYNLFATRPFTALRTSPIGKAVIKLGTALDPNSDITKWYEAEQRLAEQGQTPTAENIAEDIGAWSAGLYTTLPFLMLNNPFVALGTMEAVDQGVGIASGWQDGLDYQSAVGTMVTAGVLKYGVPQSLQAAIVNKVGVGVPAGVIRNSIKAGELTFAQGLMEGVGRSLAGGEDSTDIFLEVAAKSPKSFVQHLALFTAFDLVHGTLAREITAGNMEKALLKADVPLNGKTVRDNGRLFKTLKGQGVPQAELDAMSITEQGYSFKGARDIAKEYYKGSSFLDKGGKPFKTREAAQRNARARQLADSDYTINPTGDGFVIQSSFGLNEQNLANHLRNHFSRQGKAEVKKWADDYGKKLNKLQQSAKWSEGADRADQILKDKAIAAQSGRPTEAPLVPAPSTAAAPQPVTPEVATEVAMDDGLNRSKIDAITQTGTTEVVEPQEVVEIEPVNVPRGTIEPVDPQVATPEQQTEALDNAVMGQGEFLPGEIYVQETVQGVRPVQITEVLPDGSVKGWYVGAQTEAELGRGIGVKSLQPALFADPINELDAPEFTQEEFDRFNEVVFKGEQAPEPTPLETLERPTLREPEITPKTLAKPEDEPAPVGVVTEQKLSVEADGSPVGDVQTFQEAGLKALELRQQAEIGARDFPVIKLKDEAGEVVAHVAPNGKVFPGEEFVSGAKALFTPTAEDLQRTFAPEAEPVVELTPEAPVDLGVPPVTETPAQAEVRESKAVADQRAVLQDTLDRLNISLSAAVGLGRKGNFIQASSPRDFNPAARPELPADIGNEKQMDTSIDTGKNTPDQEVNLLSKVWESSLVTFQGGKRKMAPHVYKAINQTFTEAERAAITEVNDYFGGGGNWGIYLTLSQFPNVKTINIHEFDPGRLEKIKFIHEKGGEFFERYKDSGAKDSIDAIWKQMLTDDGVSSGSSIAKRAQIAREKGISEFDKRAILQAVVDYGNASFATNQGGVSAFIGSLATQMDDAHKAVEEFKSRGGVINYSQGDSYAVPEIQGNNVLSIVDPPYYNTKGYDSFTADGTRIPATLVKEDIYRRTEDMLNRLIDADNSVIYTDEAWWMKKEMPPNPAQGKEILRNIYNKFGNFDVVQGKIAKRHETLGVHNGNRRTQDQGLGTIRPTGDGQRAPELLGGGVAGGAVDTGKPVERQAEGEADALRKGVDQGRAGRPESGRGLEERPQFKLSESEVLDEAQRTVETRGRERRSDISKDERAARERVDKTIKRIAAIPSITKDAQKSIERIIHSPAFQRTKGFQDAYKVLEPLGLKTVAVRKAPFDGAIFGNTVMIDEKAGQERAVEVALHEAFHALAKAQKLQQLERITENLESDVGNLVDWIDIDSDVFMLEHSRLNALRRYHGMETLDVMEVAEEMAADYYADIYNAQELYGKNALRANKAKRSLSRNMAKIMADNPLMQGRYFSERKGLRIFAPTFHSNIKTGLESWQPKGTPAQLKAHLLKTRGAKNEMDWLGLDAFLAGKKTVTREEVEEFIGRNEVRVEEVVKGKVGDVSEEDQANVRFAETEVSLQSDALAEALNRYGDIDIPPQMAEALANRVVEGDQSAIAEIQDVSKRPLGMKEIRPELDALVEYTDTWQRLRSAHHSYENDQAGLAMLARDAAKDERLLVEIVGENTAKSIQINARTQLEVETQLIDVYQDDLQEFITTGQDKWNDTTKYSDYVLPGGENYREALLTLPRQELGITDDAVINELREQISRNEGQIRPEIEELIDVWVADPSERNSNAIAGNTGINPNFIAKDAGIRLEEEAGQVFRSSHFDEANILAHVRFNERTDADGDKVLFIEEIQSDWAQRGRKEGFAVKDRKVFDDAAAELGEWGISQVQKGENPNLNNEENADAINSMMPDGYKLVTDNEGKFLIEGPGAVVVETMAGSTMFSGAIQGLRSKAARSLSEVPATPFPKTWPELTMKRMIRWAAEHGFDKVAWTTGEMQADRYDLSRQITSINYSKQPNGIFVITTRGLADEIISPASGGFTPEKIEQTFGKEIRKKIEADEGQSMDDIVPSAEEAAKDLGYKVRRAVEADGFDPENNIEWVVEFKDGSIVGQRTKEDADRLVRQDRIKENDIKPIEPGVKHLTGLDLKVGGEGMKGFYDRIIPSFVKKYTKKWGGEVSETSIPGGGGKRFDLEWMEGTLNEGQRVEDTEGGFESFNTAKAAQKFADTLGIGHQVNVVPAGKVQVHSLELTEAMKDAVLFEGQPLFKLSEELQAKAPEDLSLAEMKELRDEANLAVQGIRDAGLDVPAEQIQQLQDLSNQIEDIESGAFQKREAKALPGRIKKAVKEAEKFGRVEERERGKEEQKQIHDKYKQVILDIKDRVKGIRARQAAVIKYAQENLDPEQRGRILARNKNLSQLAREATTEKRFEEILEFINKIRDENEARQERSKLTKNVKKIKKFGINKLSPTRKDAVESILASIDLKTPKARTDLKRMIQNMKDDPENNVPDYVLDEALRTDRTPIREMELDEIRYLNMIIETVKNEQKVENVERKKSKIRENKLKVKSGIATVEETAKNKIPEDEILGDEVTGSENLGGLKRRYRAWHVKPSTIAYEIDGGKEGAITKGVINPLWEGTRNSLLVEKTITVSLRDFLADNKIDVSKWSRAFATPAQKVLYKKLGVEGRLTKTVPDLFEYTIGGKQVKVSKGERIALYLHSKNPDNLRHLLDKRGGFVFPFKESATPLRMKPDEMKKILDDMTEDEIKVGDFMSGLYENQMADFLNETSLKMNGFEIAGVVNYFPIVSSSTHRHYDAFGSDVTDKDVKRFTKFFVEGQGALKPRASGSSNPIILYDAFLALDRSTQMTALYHGMAEPLRDVKAFLSGSTVDAEGNMKTVQGTIINEYGMRTWDALSNLVRDIENTQNQIDPIDTISLKLLNNYTRGILAVNLPVAGMQVVSYATSGAVLPAKYWGAGSISKPANYDEMGEFSPVLWKRGEGHVSIAMGEAIRPARARQMALGDKGKLLSEKGMEAIIYMDRQAIGRIWRAAEAWVRDWEAGNRPDPDKVNDQRRALLEPPQSLKNQMSSNMPFEEKVARVTEYVIRESQPSFEPVDRPMLARSKNIYAKLVMRFTSQRGKNYSLKVKDLIQYNNSKAGMADKLRSMKLKVLLYILVPTMISLIRGARRKLTGFEKEEDMPLMTFLTDLLSTNVSDMTGLISTISSVFIDDFEFSSPMAEILNVGSQGIKELWKAAEQFTNEETTRSGEAKWKRSALRGSEKTGRVLSRSVGSGAWNIYRDTRNISRVIKKFLIEHDLIDTENKQQQQLGQKPQGEQKEQL